MNLDLLKKEIVYKAVRSSGPGGQNVNKVATKVILEFHIDSSQALSPEQKEVLKTKLATKINSTGFLILSSSETRSQLKNKEITFEKLVQLLQNSLKVEVKRIATKIPKAVIKKRLNDKKIQSIKKKLRKNKDY